MRPPALADWARMSWRSRQEWARRHDLSLTDATLAVVRAHAPLRGRPLPPVDGWTDAQHLASLRGDQDPDVVAERRLVASGLNPTHPDIRRGLPTRSLL